MNKLACARGRRIEHGGESLTLTEWAHKTSIRRSLLYSRLKRMPIAEALAEPASPKPTPRTVRKARKPTGRLIEFGGTQRTVRQWAEAIGLGRSTLYMRLMTLPIAQALERPLQRPSDRAVQLTHNGRTQGAHRWAKELGITRQALTARIKREGVDQALNAQARAQRPKSTRRGRIYEYAGQKRSISQWAEALDVSIWALYRRLERGHPPDRVFAPSRTPARLDPT